MGIFDFLKKKVGKHPNTIPISELAKDTIPKDATILYQSEVPEWTLIGNLLFEKKYNEAIELGKKLLEKDPDSAGVHIELMVAYFKLRNNNPEYFDLSTYHAKRAIICGHNTGYAHERLVINLEKNGMINQAIQLCDIVLSENYHFSVMSCGKKEDFLFRKEKLKYKLNFAKDTDSIKLFTDNEIILLYENQDILETGDKTIKHPGFTISNEEIEKELKRIRDKANGVSKEYVLPKKPQLHVIDSIPLGLQFENVIKLLPEFDFYVNEKSGFTDRHLNFMTDQKQGKAIWALQKEFNELIDSAAYFEHDGNLDKAATIYERIIAEQYWLHTPYDRLIKIYSRAKLKSNEIRVLEYAINHLSELRERQKQYVLFLAEKYGKLDFANEQIVNNKKISYYGGAFELYNPYPIIDEWKKRLNKIELNGKN